MVWPVNAIPTTGMDADTDDLPRAEFKNGIDALNSIMVARGAASGICELDASAKVPIARLPPPQRLHHIGEIFMWGGAVAAPGCFFADGHAISRTVYAALFGVFGTTFGPGDGSTTFNLPDCRDRVIVGRGDMGVGPANRITAAATGLNTALLGAAGGHQYLQTHDHPGTVTGDGAHTHTASQAAAGGAVGGGGFPQYFEHNIDVPVSGTGAHAHGVVINLAGVGSSQNIQPSIVLNVCVQAD